MAVLGRSRSGPPPDQILDPPLQYVLYPLKSRQISHIPHRSIKCTNSYIKIRLIQVKSSGILAIFPNFH